MSRRPREPFVAPEPPILEGIDASLLDIVDHVLTKGIVLTGDLVLGVADVDLVYLRLSAVLCAADRVLYRSPEPEDGRSRRRAARRSKAPPTLLSRKVGAPKLGVKRS